MAGYDRLVGNRIYNRIVWGTSVASYAAFAQAAVTGAEGPFLDVGCGSAIFTAQAYRRADRPLVLLDRSLGMLARARQRMAADRSDRVAFVQGDLFDLPFRAGAFTTVACHGLLHLFEDVHAVLQALRGPLAVAGTLYASSLVADRRLGRRWLQLMHRTGEAASPRTASELIALTRAEPGQAVADREGSMVFLRLAPHTRI